MPKLLVFAACERVIIDQDNNVSLMNLVTEMTTEVPEQSEREADKLAVAALRWAIFALWAKDPQDEGKTFEQRVILLDPSGAPSGIEGATPFAFPEGKRFMRNTVNVLGFPFKSAGTYRVQLWMRQEGGVPAAEPIAEFPINMKQRPPKEGD